MKIMDLTAYQPLPVTPLGEDFAAGDPAGNRLSVNSYYLEKNGRPFFPVSGEFHYSRMEPGRWEDELIKIRMGGVNVVSTYIFWNHVEEKEGRFDFTGRRDLRRFVSLCAKHGLYVILRVGPFAHGEARNGGLPDWLYGKPFEVRTTDPGFLRYVRRLYARIGEQVKDLFYQDGGPVIGVQLDNEYMHSSAMWEMTTGISDEWVNRGDEGEAYILALRDIALSCGLTPAFLPGRPGAGRPIPTRSCPCGAATPTGPGSFIPTGANIRRPRNTSTRTTITAGRTGRMILPRPTTRRRGPTPAAKWAAA